MRNTLPRGRDHEIFTFVNTDGKNGEKPYEYETERAALLSLKDWSGLGWGKFAKRCGLSAAVMTGIGNRTKGSFETFHAVAEAFNLSWDEFIRMGSGWKPGREVSSEPKNPEPAPDASIGDRVDKFREEMGVIKFRLEKIEAAIRELQNRPFAKGPTAKMTKQ